MINIKYIAKRCIPLLVAGTTGLTMYSCSNRKEENKKINVDNNEAYTLEQYEGYPFQYKVLKYNADKCKNQEYEFKPIKSYDIKCTPENFGQYTKETNVTWDELKNTAESTNFDDYHKQLLIKGINNLQKNNFNMNLSVINYNLKNIKIKYESKYERESINGTFNCFEHEMTISDHIENKEEYESVFLHEILGHGMTDAYIEDSKVYCSIDQPTYIIDNEGNYVGGSFYGQAFEESMAQIIAITALDNELKPEYGCAYDMSMVEMLMILEDNNCNLVDYANKGVDYLTYKMKVNRIDDPNGIIAVITYNLSETDSIITPSEEVMYNYFREVVDDSYEEGKSIEQIEDRVSKAFNSFGNYVLIYNDPKTDGDVVGLKNDIMNITKLYDDIGKYAVQKRHTLSK